MTTTDAEKIGWDIFYSTMSNRHPDWTITPTTDFSNQESQFTQYDVTVIDSDGENNFIELKARPEYHITTFPDISIDKHKIDFLVNAVNTDRCRRAYIVGIYVQDDAMAIWRVKPKHNWKLVKKRWPKKTVLAEGEQKEWIEKWVYELPMEEAKIIETNQDK